MLYSETDPESYITEYTLAYEDFWVQIHQEGGMSWPCVQLSSFSLSTISS